MSGEAMDLTRERELFEAWRGLGYTERSHQRAAWAGWRARASLTVLDQPGTDSVSVEGDVSNGIRACEVCGDPLNSDIQSESGEWRWCRNCQKLRRGTKQESIPNKITAPATRERKQDV